MRGLYTARFVRQFDAAPAEIQRGLPREQTATPFNPKRTRAEFGQWLDKFAAFSENIPPIPGETFSREMIYQAHGGQGTPAPPICDRAANPVS